jgi:hypothetical protein
MTMTEKKFPLDNYIKYLDTDCELAKMDKVQVIEIVSKKKKGLYTNLSD